MGYTNKKFNRVFLNSSQFIKIWNTNQVLYAVLDFHVTLHVSFGYPGQSIKVCIRSYQTVDRFYDVEVLIKCTFSGTQSPYLVSLANVHEALFDSPKKSLLSIKSMIIDQDLVLLYGDHSQDMHFYPLKVLETTLLQ